MGTEDGSKVFTRSIIFAMYSKSLISILDDSTTTKELPFISLPVSSCLPVMNLIKILTEGTVLSSESESLLEVGKNQLRKGKSRRIADFLILKTLVLFPLWQRM